MKILLKEVQIITKVLGQQFRPKSPFFLKKKRHCGSASMKIRGANRKVSTPQTSPFFRNFP